MKQYLTLMAALMLLAPLSAATYYASPDGSGNGSYNSPCSFANGLKKLSQPGDTLYLFSGQYDLLTTDIKNLNGTAARRIVISGYEGINRSGTYAAILDFRQTAYGSRGLQIKSSCSYLHIKNLTLRYSGKNNLHNAGTYCLFENLDIYGSADTGCQMKCDDNGTGGHSNVIKNVDSHDNFDYETLGNGGVANFAGNADGFADKQFTGPGNHDIGCRAWNNSDDGWDFFQRVSTSNSVIEHCICYQNGPLYYDMSTHPRATGVDKSWFDSKEGTQMTDRYKQTITITLAQYPCQGNGNGFKMGGGHTDHKLLIHHCLAVGNYARGFDQNNNGGTMWLYNNTAYDNHTNYGFTAADGTNTTQNCISLASRNTDSYRAQNVVAIDHNSWDNGYSVSTADFQSLDQSLILVPRNGNSALPENDFMRLAEGSLLIDAGVDINLGYNGLAPDLGCYEAPGEEHLPEPEDTVPAVQPAGTHAVAFVTTPGSSSDKPLLRYLRRNDSLWIVETNAADASVDYSAYELIVLGPKPNSSAAGYSAIKELTQPKVLLKPFLLKQSVWGWGSPSNTSDLAITIPVEHQSHPLFESLTITDDTLQLFSQCSTNAVTAISEWTETGLTTLAAPTSQPTYSTVALKENFIMIGVSEYSTVYLTDDAKQLIENAILYLLGIEMPTDLTNHKSQITNRKYIQNGQLFIQTGDRTYDALGRRVR